MSEIVDLREGQIVTMHGLFWLIDKSEIALSEIALSDHLTDYDPRPYDATMEIKCRAIPEPVSPKEALEDDEQE